VRYGSVCSGIEAASVAWEPLGWQPAWFAEIADFPSKVLAHRLPSVENHGSLVGLADRLAGPARQIDLLVGGTPCQPFSVAGLGGGLADERGNLALEYCRLAEALRPRWCVWENVPNVLSKRHAADFASIVGALVHLGYGVAWRVLDARFFGVPQRRRRVFLVASLGGAAAAGAVLFEPESRSRNLEARGAAGQEAPRAAAAGARGGGEILAKCLTTSAQRLDPEVETLIATNAEGADGFTLTRSNLSKTVNNQTPLVCFDPTQVTSATAPVVAETARRSPLRPARRTSPTRRARRLTPRECERLQGFPDDWTAILGASDSGRYAALGNSMAVPVMRWIGERIELVDNIINAT